MDLYSKIQSFILNRRQYVETRIAAVALGVLDEAGEIVTISQTWGDTPYSKGSIVLDREGIWKAIKDNCGSRPVSGNTDWTLVGGTPYVDVTLDPVQISTPPFNDPSFSGPGFDAIPAPGEGFFVWVTRVQNWVSEGTDWSNIAAAFLCWGDASIGANDFRNFLMAHDSINDALNAYDISPDNSYPYLYSIIVDDYANWANGIAQPNLALSVTPSLSENKPIRLVSNSDIIGGSRSITYRIWYRVLPVSTAFPALFHIIGSVDQGTKKFVVGLGFGDDDDASGLTGSIFVVGSTGNNGTYTIISTRFNGSSAFQSITGVNQGTNTFTVAGDQTGEFLVGRTPRVSGSTGNDGTYTIVSATFVTDHTDIVVAEAIPDSTADGTINGGNGTTDIVVAESIPDPTADGWVKQ